MRSISWLLALIVSPSCVALRTEPRLDSRLTSQASEFIEGATLTSWSELLPHRDPNHGYLHLLTLGLVPRFGELRTAAHVRVDWPDRVDELGRLEVTQESVTGWLAWCWWFSPHWEMGSLFHELERREQRIQTTLLNRMAIPTSRESAR